MRIETIDDLDDPRVALYRNVKDSALRDARGVFLAESRLCVRRLLELERFRVQSVFVTRAALDALTEQFDTVDREFPIYLASAAVMKRVVGYPMHRGCVAAAERGEPMRLDSLLSRAPRTVVGLEGVANPENVGSVFRNAAAFGADAVLLTRDCADPLYRKAIRVSMGATLRLPFAHVDDWPQTLGRLHAAGLTTLAFSARPTSIELADVEPSDGENLALLFGAEGSGLRPATAAAAQRVVRIPMTDGIDSLNIATASGVALHHCFARGAIAARGGAASVHRR